MLFRIVLLTFLSLVSTHAIIVEKEEELISAHEAGSKLKEDLFPGKIVLRLEDKLLEYCSAVAFGKPGMQETQTILTCAHIIHFAAQQIGIGQFYFEDHKGKLHIVNNIVPLTKGSENPMEDINPVEDIALCFLEAPVACNPLLRLAETAALPEKLSCLTYGMTLSTEAPFTVGNLEGEKVYSLTSNFSKEEDNYTKKFTANRVVQMTRETGTKTREMYVAEPQSAPQIFTGDSGAPWFGGNAIDGFTLYALTCGFSGVEADDKLNCKPGNLIKKVEYSRLGDNGSLSLFQLPKPASFVNFLISLAPNREWILENLK